MTERLFPVSLKLAGRRAVVVGGGGVAARRASALVSADAIVTIVAPELSADARALADTGAVTWIARGYAPGDLDGAWFAVTATGVDEVDDLVAADADAARVWCARAGDPAASRAWTPAVARSGDVTVAVSTGGDPRRAMAIRDAVQSSLDAGELPLRHHRRRPAAAASAEKPGAGAGTGRVALVGGGPGDPALMTLRAKRLLAEADVVVADRLGPRSVLAELDPGVLVIDVGKLPGNHAVPQHEINRILVEQALLGRRVVRLKGGDPYVLGRGGEEADACHAAGVPVEVVPGVTSAISVPAAVGIPVTHRGVSTGFTVVTGHAGVETAPGGADHTLVVLMGVSALPRIAETLSAGARGADCPVVLIEDGYGDRQRATFGTLRDIAGVARERGVASPAVIVIGDVVRLSPLAPGRLRRGEGRRPATAAVTHRTT